MVDFKIIFVGDCPSKKNSDPKIPFIGTESGKRLRKWITMLSTELAIVDIAPQFDFTNSHTQKELDKLRDICQNTESSYLIVTLGIAATKRVTSKLKMRVWKLGHPSPRNRAWNNPEVEINQIKKIARYIANGMLNNNTEPQDPGTTT